LLASLSACGGNAASVSTAQTKSPATRQPSPVQQQPSPGADGAAASVLRFAQGRWVGSCRAEPLRSPYRLTLSFSGLQLTEETSIYQDSGCQQRLSTWSRKLAILTVHSFDPDGDSDVFGFDLNVEAHEVTMTTYGGYGAIAGELCGLRSWTDGVARDVSGRDCGAGRLETTGTDSVLYIQHDPDSNELLYEDEALERQ
jgi:hypothetical protein